MPKNHSSTSLRLLALALTLVLGSIVSSAPAEAQRVNVRATATAKKAVGSKKALIKEFGVRPHAKVQSKIGNKPLLHISKTKGKKYEKHLDRSVELIFKPMGSTGHSYMRVGRKIYDFAFWARENSFKSPTGDAYGFVMMTTKEKIQTIQRGFNQLMARDPEFSMTGTGHNNTFSCAGFISHVMQNHAPELGITLTPSAVGLASRLMRGNAEAVTVYGGKSRDLTNGNFQFEKL